MRQDSLRLFGGLLWYLEARNWAFEKMKTSPHGSNAFDLRMHHSLFFVNLMSAVDHITDHLKDRKAFRDKEAFIDRITGGFAKGEYQYIRELRNSVVHRGLDLTAAGHSDQTNLYVLCPETVEDRDGNTYSCSFTYLHELAQKCREVIDPAIYGVLEGLRLFDPQLHELDRTETVNAINSATAMPDWAKALANQALERMDFSDLSSELAKSRVENMRKLLTPS